MANLFKSIAKGAAAGRAREAARAKLKIQQDQSARADVASTIAQDKHKLETAESAAEYQEGIWEMTRGDEPVHFDELIGKLKLGEQMYKGKGWYINSRDLLADLHATSDEMKQFTGGEDEFYKSYKERIDGMGGLPENVKIASGDERDNTDGKKYEFYTGQKLMGHKVMKYYSEEELKAKFPKWDSSGENKKAFDSLHGFMDGEAQARHQHEWEKTQVEILETRQDLNEKVHGGTAVAGIMSAYGKNFKNGAFDDPGKYVEFMAGVREEMAGQFSQEFIDDTLDDIREMQTDNWAQEKAADAAHDKTLSNKLAWKRSINATIGVVSREIVMELGGGKIDLNMDGKMETAFSDPSVAAKYKTKMSKAMDYITAGMSSGEVLRRLDPKYKPIYPRNVKVNGKELKWDQVDELVGDVYDKYGLVNYDGKFYDPSTGDTHDIGKFLNRLEIAKTASLHNMVQINSEPFLNQSDEFTIKGFENE